MSILQDWYPGDRLVEVLLIVALGVLILSAAAWCVARVLSKMPAARHLVLISAIFGCLAMPVMAAVFQRVRADADLDPGLAVDRSDANSGEATRHAG